MAPEVVKNWLQATVSREFDDAPCEWLCKSLEAASGVSRLIRSDFLRKYNVADWDAPDRLAWKLRTDAPLQATFLYRIANHLFLSDPSDPLLDILSYVMRSRTGIEIYYSSSIGEGFCVQHGTGLVIGPRHRIGRNFTAYQGVTLGQRRQNCPEEFLEIGDNCVLFAGAKLLGNLRIGSGVKVAANAVLLCDAEDGATYGGVPAKRIA